MLKKFAVLALALSLAAPAAIAAPLSADAITKALDQTAADSAKLKTYCDMGKRMDEIGDDEQKATAAEAEIEGYFKALGPEFQAVWDTGREVKDDSAEAKALEDGLSKLDDKCAP